MREFFESFEIDQYMPAALEWATNIALAILILLIGYLFAGWVARQISRTGTHYEKLDSTLFSFLGSIARTSFWPLRSSPCSIDLACRRHRLLLS